MILLSAQPVSAFEKEAVYSYNLTVAQKHVNSASLAEDLEIMKKRLSIVLSENEYFVELTDNIIHLEILVSSMPELQSSQAERFMLEYICGIWSFALVDSRSLMDTDDDSRVQSEYADNWFDEALVTEDGSIRILLSDAGEKFRIRPTVIYNDPYTAETFGAEISPESLLIWSDIYNDGFHSYGTGGEMIYNPADRTWTITDPDFIGEYPELTAYNMAHPSVKTYYSLDTDPVAKLEDFIGEYGKYQTSRSALENLDIYFACSNMDAGADIESVLKNFCSRMDLLKQPYAIDYYMEDRDGTFTIRVVTGRLRISEWMPRMLLEDSFIYNIDLTYKDCTYSGYRLRKARYEPDRGLVLNLSNKDEIKKFFGTKDFSGIGEEYIYLEYDSHPLFRAQIKDYDPETKELTLNEVLYKDAYGSEEAWLQEIFCTLFTQGLQDTNCFEFYIDEQKILSDQPYGLENPSTKECVFSAAARFWPWSDAELIYDEYDGCIVTLTGTMNILEDFTEETWKSLKKFYRKTAGSDPEINRIEVELRDTESNTRVVILLESFYGQIEKTVYDYNWSSCWKNPVTEHVKSILNI